MVEISFIIPARSEAKLLPATLAAIEREIQRTSITAEIIVVDNGSYDDTARVVQAFGRARMATEARKGLARARAAGLALATGQLIAQVDADTILPVGWLDHVRNEFLRTPSLVGLSGPYIYYDLPPLYQAFTKLYYKVGMLVAAALRLVGRPVWMMQGGNLVARRETLEAIGGYNPRFQFFGEDTDLGCRLGSKGLVRFSFELVARSSGRRLLQEGVMRTGCRYAINFIWAALLKRPFTVTWKDVR